MQRILLLGGHGKVSMLMTPKLLARSWQVISVVRNPDHASEIQAAAAGQPGKLDVWTRSLDDVQTEEQARAIIDEAKADCVVWAAGAGGKGGVARTYAIDRDAAQAFIRASVRAPSVKKFLMLSYVGSRRARAPWWDDADLASSEHFNNDLLPDYAKAKLAADECLVALAGHGGPGFRAIVLRPGTLSDDAATGAVVMGKISPRGRVSRADVADVAAYLLEAEGASGYFDLMAGDRPVAEEVGRVVREGVDTLDGEDVEAIKARYSL